jgi:hypothetical protein
VSTKIKALKSFTNNNSGALTTYAKGQVYTVDDTPAAAFISAGLAEAYTLITPTGKKEITANGDDIDVAAYAKVKVAVE